MKFLTGEIFSIILFFIGLYGVIARKNVIKTIISLGIMQTAIVIFFITIKSDGEKLPPINIVKSLPGTSYADPMPQALMITAIVIGITFTAVSLTMFINLYYKYGTKNWSKIAERRIGKENE